jgi:6-pyruvoyl-tetrahydropterin synthase
MAARAVSRMMFATALQPASDEDIMIDVQTVKNHLREILRYLDRSELNHRYNVD